MSKSVFISYATDDTQIAEQIRDGLESAGIPCWMAPRDIVPGKEYAEQILDAIEGCQVMVLVVSETSNVSRFVRSEVERAVSKDKVVIPIRIHEVTLSRSMEFFISSAQWIDALDRVDGAMPVLTSAIRQHVPVHVAPNAESEEETEGQRPPHNLPSPTTPFIGRSREIDDILSRLLDPACRLLTLVGQGGLGKTRLAIEVAHRAHEHVDTMPDGVYFVALETLSQADQIPGPIALSLGLPAGGADPWQLALHFLADKRLLLVLDNFEHLLEGAGLVAEMLAACPGVKVLATSRELLNLQEEWLAAIGGLDLPVVTVDSLEQAERSGAVRLFLHVARRLQAGRDFAADLPCVVRLCHLVEGVPLALELAAHWVRVLSCNQIVEQLQSNLDVLATPMRNVPERHRSMRAVFDYSWQLAPSSERIVLCQLAVFAGGFDWPAFQAVTRGSLAELAALVDSSWVQAGGEERYSLHPLVRSYLQEKLTQEYANLASEDAEMVRDRHSQYYSHIASVYNTPVIFREISNLLVGWRHAIQFLDIDSLRRYIEPMSSFQQWPLPLEQTDALLAESVARVRRQRIDSDPSAASGAHDLLEAMLLSSRLSHARRAGRLSQAERLGADALDVLEAAGDEPEPAAVRFRVLTLLGHVKSYQGRYAETYRLFEKAQAIADGLSETYPDLLLLIDYFRSTQAIELGHYAEAEALLGGLLQRLERSDSFGLHIFLAVIAVQQGAEESALQHLRAARTLSEYALHIGRLELDNFEAQYELLVGNAARAYDLCHTILPELRTYGYALVVVRTLVTLGRACLGLGKLDEAEATFTEAYQLADDMPYVVIKVQALIGLGAIAIRRDRRPEAQGRFVKALALAWPSGILPEVLEAVAGLAEIKALTQDIGTARRWLQVAIAHPSTAHLVRVHAQDVLKGLGESAAPDEIPDPQAALTEIVTQILAGDGQDAA